MGPIARAQRVLPDFERPPVVEIAIGVEFLPVAGFDLARLLDLHLRWRERYPVLQQQAALPATPPPGSMLAGIGLRFGQGPEPLRFWLLSEDQRTLLQVQNDRIILNWRRLEPGDEYPRYLALQPEFEQRWQQFVEWTADLGPVQPTVADVTFVNVITSPEGRADLSAIMTTAIPVPDLPGSMVESFAHYTLDVSGDSGRQAHLVATAGPSLSGDEDVSLQIVTRVALRGDDNLTDMMNALDHAHDKGVLGFTALTRQPMHEAWGRTE